METGVSEAGMAAIGDTLGIRRSARVSKQALQ
jgi:hypothetical protein